MRYSHYKILLVGGGLLPAGLWGQNTPPTPEPTVETRVVEVVRNFEGEITDTDRRTLPLRMNDSIDVFSSSFTYKIEPEALPVFSITQDIPPAAITERHNASADRYGYARIGAGLPPALLGDLYLHRAAGQALFNLYYNHRSSRAAVPLAIDPPDDSRPTHIAGHTAQNDAGLSASVRVSRTLLHFNVDYKHRTLLYHGYDTAYLRHLSINRPDYLEAVRRHDAGVRKALRQTYNMVTAEAGVASLHSPNRFSYYTDVQFGYTGGAFAAVDEYAGSLCGRLSQPFTTVHSADMAFEATAYNKGNASRWSDGLFAVTPAYVYRRNPIQLSAGLNIEGVYTSHDEKLSLGVYPALSFTGRFSDYLTLHASVEGKTSCHTYRQLALENPYIMPNLTVENTQKPWEATIGAGGRIFNVAGYHIFGAYGRFDRMYFYVNSRDSLPAPDPDPLYDGLRQAFDVLYGKTNRLTVGADFDCRIDDFEAIVQGRYYAYSFRRESPAAKAWHKPAWELTGSLRYRYERYLFQAGWQTLGAAPVYLGEVDDDDARLPVRFDLSLQVEYRLNKWLTAFVYGQNLLNQRYRNYYLYYSEGITGGAGLTVVF
jgi:hypothetical protein